MLTSVITLFEYIAFLDVCGWTNVAVYIEFGEAVSGPVVVPAAAEAMALRVAELV